MSDESEKSEGGSNIYRHTERKKEFEFAPGDEQSIEIISRHIARHIGEPENVFHELVSDLVHIDVHIVAPTEARPFYTLVTSGMSDKPMTVPEGAEEYRYAELMLSLPPDWPMTGEEFEADDNFWPVGLLKFLARFPHEFETWIGPAHTIPNGDPPEPFSANTELCCALITPPLMAPDEFQTLRVNDEKTIQFHGVIALYREEMELKLKKGMDALTERLDPESVSELLDIKRKNTAKKRFGIF